VLTYKILGPLEVVRDGATLPLGPAKQRALLARLLLSPNETVSKDRLIDDLWGQSPPARAEQNLFQHVFRLRKALDDGGRTVILTRDPGYLIQVGAEDRLDARRFEDLHARSHVELEEEPARALATLDEALALWRGPALVEFAYENFAQDEAWRLDELRLAAEEGRMEALLALGRHKEAIPRLRTLVHGHPTREHLNALLGLALYRAGRQTEALTSIQETKKALAAEHGIDPGPELRQLEEAILRQDPALDLAEPTPAPTIETVPEVIRGEIPADRERRRNVRRRRSRLVMLAATLVIPVAIVVTAAVLIAPIDKDPSHPPVGSTGNGDTTATSGQPPEVSSLSWDEVPPTYFEGVGQQKVLGGLETSSGFLVFGYTTVPTEFGPKDFDAAVWSGAPDRAWERITSSDFRGPGRQRATDAVEFGDDVVLVGWDETAEGFDGAAWLGSVTSGAWEKADIQAQGPNSQLDQRIRDVAKVSQTLWAVGWTSSASDQDAALWTSNRGKQWIFQEGTPPHEEGDQEIAGAATAEGVLVAGGWSESPGGDRDAAVWFLRNARFLKMVRGQADLGGPGNQQINAVIAFKNGFLAVGEETLDGDTNAAVWLSPSGKEWLRLDDDPVFAGEGDQRMFAVAASPTGLVAGGSDRIDSQHWDASVWTSPDGEHWERPTSGPGISTFADIGDQEIKALVPFGDGFLALGNERPQGGDWDARVWIGTPTA